MDSVIFQALAVELNNSLANSRLDKVVQTSAGTLVLKLWTGEEKVQLLLKAEGKGAFYLSREKYTAPAKPPRICQLLRARLRRLLEVRAEPLDRIVHFLFVGSENTRYDLVLEVFGSQGNLILIDQDGIIVDLLYRGQGKRCLMPGQEYLLPEQSQRISLFGDIPLVSSTLQEAEDQGDYSFSRIAPMSAVLAHSIRSARQSGQAYDAILSRINDTFRSEHFDALKVAVNDCVGLLPFRILDEGTELERYDDLSQLVECDLIDDSGAKSKDLAARMRAIISRQYKFLAKRKTKIAAERERQANPDTFKQTGELLLANLHRIQRGDASVEVEDYYQSPPVSVMIELDSKSSPQENAERYFKQYQKAKRSGEHHKRRLQETDDELAWLQQVELALDEAQSGEDLYQVQLELETAGLLKKAKGQLAKRQPVRVEDQLNKATSPAGWQLYWGKNSRTNDYVSRSMTSAQDYWFHARGMPGSHVVLKCGDNAATVAEEDIIYAASIAAGYSKGKNDSKVEVIVAKGKDVKKPKGAKPGLVTVESYRSVLVAPQRLDG